MLLVRRLCAAGFRFKVLIELAVRGFKVQGSKFKVQEMSWQCSGLKFKNLAVFVNSTELS